MKLRLLLSVLKVSLFGFAFCSAVSAGGALAADVVTLPRVITDFETGTVEGWDESMVVYTPGASSNFGGEISTPENGSAGSKLIVNSPLLSGYANLEFDVNLNGANILPGDASAVVVEQSGWKMVSLSHYAQNGVTGWQHIIIPLSDFPNLRTADGIAFFQLRFWNTAGTVIDVDNLNLTGVSTPDPNPAPSNLLGTATSETEVSLSWQGNSPSYNIYKDGQKVTAMADNSFIVSGLVRDTNYHFYITGQNGLGESAPCSEIIVKTLGGVTPTGGNIFSDYETGLNGWADDARLIAGNGSAGAMRLPIQSNSSAESHKIIDGIISANATQIEFDVNLNGATLLPGDASALVFEQGGWKWISISNRVVGGSSAWQHVIVPFADIAGFDPTSGVAYLKFRFWNNSISNIDIDNIAIGATRAEPPTEPVDPPIEPPVDPPTEPDPTIPPADQGVPNGSLEQNSNNVPTGWRTNTYLINTPSFTYAPEGHTGTHSAKVEITDYTSGDSKWFFDPQDVSPNQLYEFSLFYKSNINSTVTVEVQKSDGTFSYLTLGQISASPDNWTRYLGTFTTPALTRTITIFQGISAVGWLLTDDYTFKALNMDSQSFSRGLVSIAFDDGVKSIYENGFPIMEQFGYDGTIYLVTDYLNTPNHVTTAQVTEMKNAGFVIGSHTIDHPHLTQLTAADLTHELQESKQILESNFGTVTSIAASYGEYDNNVIEEIKKYYDTHRTVDSGTNTKLNFDKYLIKSFSIKSTDSLQSIEGWIKDAADNKTWIVLSFHDIDLIGADEYNNTPERLSQILSLIRDTYRLPVLTIDQAVAEITLQI